MIISAIQWHKPNKDGLYPIKIKLYENRKNKYISTELSVQRIQWSTTNNRVLNNHSKADYFNSIIKNLLDSYNEVDEYEETFGNEQTGTLSDLFTERIKNFQSSNRISAVKKYTTILRHLKELKLTTLPLSTINKEHINLLHQYLINKRRLTNASLRNYHKVMKTTLTYAIDNPRFVLPRFDPYHKFDAIKENGGTKVTLKLSDVHTLDEALHFEIKLFSKEFYATSHFLLAFYLMGITKTTIP